MGEQAVAWWNEEYCWDGECRDTAWPCLPLSGAIWRPELWTLSAFPSLCESAVCWEPYFHRKGKLGFSSSSSFSWEHEKGVRFPKMLGSLWRAEPAAPGPALWLHVDPAEEGKFELSCVENLSNPSILKIFRPCSTHCCKTWVRQVVGFNSLERGGREASKPILKLCTFIKNL